MDAPGPTAPPPSATHGGVAAAGLIAFLGALAVLHAFRPFGERLVDSALFAVAFTALVSFSVDRWVFKAEQRPSTGLNPTQRDPSWDRSTTKFLGLCGSLGALFALYWLFPEYHRDFYAPYYGLLLRIVPLWLLLALPYFHYVDARMREPRDGYWQMGQALMLNWSAVDRKILAQHVLGWLIKGFFLPLMFGFLCNDLGRFLKVDFATLTGFSAWFEFLFALMYCVDVGLVTMGYLLALRITDTHLRSAEPTMTGWVVALVCYEPFWPLIGRQYLDYEPKLLWGAWLGDLPVLYVIWGSTILLLTAIYTWATVSFGARFSNLTHRGIITNGPYRYCKHPAYLAKNLSWWLISVPFLVTESSGQTLRHCLLLLGLNLIYLVRAKTEERHLSADPVYRDYADWIDARRLFEAKSIKIFVSNRGKFHT